MSTPNKLEAKELRKILHNNEVDIASDITDKELYNQQDIIHQLLRWMQEEKILKKLVDEDRMLVSLLKFRKDFNTKRNNPEELAIKLYIYYSVTLNIPEYLKNVILDIDEYIIEEDENEHGGEADIHINIEETTSLYPLMFSYETALKAMELYKLKIKYKDNEYYTLIEKYIIQEIKETTKSLNMDNTVNIETILILIKPHISRLNTLIRKHITLLRLKEQMQDNILNLEKYIKDLYNSTQPSKQQLNGLIRQYIKILKQLENKR